MTTDHGKPIQSSLPIVLLVDDDPSLLEMQKVGLHPFANRFQILTAKHGKEALEKLRQQSISFVVTDLMMPVMDGFELLTRMMEEFPEVPRMVVSSSQLKGPLERLQEDGTLEVMAKPVHPAVLGEKICRGLEGGKMGPASCAVFP